MVDQTKRLDGGLQKLIEAADHLAELNEKLQVQKAHVDEQTQVSSFLFRLSSISSNVLLLIRCAQICWRTSGKAKRK